MNSSEVQLEEITPEGEEGLAIVGQADCAVFAEVVRGRLMELASSFFEKAEGPPFIPVAFNRIYQVRGEISKPFKYYDTSSLARRLSGVGFRSLI